MIMCQNKTMLIILNVVSTQCNAIDTQFMLCNETTQHNTTNFLPVGWLIVNIGAVSIFSVYTKPLFASWLL